MPTFGELSANTGEDDGVGGEDGFLPEARRNDAWGKRTRGSKERSLPKAHRDDG